MGLFIHRAGMIAIAPIVWIFATIAYLVTAPIAATAEVLSGIKRHWNDQ